MCCYILSSFVQDKQDDKNIWIIIKYARGFMYIVYKSLLLMTIIWGLYHDFYILFFFKSNCTPSFQTAVQQCSKWQRSKYPIVLESSRGLVRGSSALIVWFSRSWIGPLDKEQKWIFKLGIWSPPPHGYRSRSGYSNKYREIGDLVPRIVCIVAEVAIQTNTEK
jgi:hypothetical protein